MKIRHFIPLIWLLLCLANPLRAQHSLLETKVTLQCKQLQIGTILSELSKKYSLKFSYSSNIVDEPKRVSISMKQVMLKDALTEVFKESEVAFQVIADQIVLKKGNRTLSLTKSKKKEVTTTDSRPVLFEPGDIYDGAGVGNDEKIIQDSSTNDYGFSINSFDSFALLDDDEAPSKKELKLYYKGERKLLKAKFIGLKDSLLRKGGGSVELLELKYSYLSQKLKQELNARLKRLENASPETDKSLGVKDSTGGFDKDSSAGSAGSANDSTRDNYRYVPIQVSFITPLGTNGIESGATVNKVSFNVIGGYHAGLDGIELGGVANVEKDFVKGIQLAGVANVVGGKTKGIQLAGYGNICGDSVSGIQGAGFLNVVKGSMHGIQYSGFCNVNKGALNGIQVAGFANISKDSVSGIQAAGFINVASYVKGVQLGIFNSCDSIKGIPIGLFSMVKHGGYNAFEVFNTEALHVNLAYKIGVRQFYNVFTTGVQFRPASASSQVRFAYGYGVGTSIPLSKKITVNFDNVVLHVLETNWLNRELNLLNRLHGAIGVRLGKTATLYAGPSLNVMVSSQHVDGNTEPGSNLAPYSLVNETFSEGSKDVNLKIWFGYTAGIRF